MSAVSEDVGREIAEYADKVHEVISGFSNGTSLEAAGRAVDNLAKEHLSPEIAERLDRCYPDKRLRDSLDDLCTKVFETGFDKALDEPMRTKMNQMFGSAQSQIRLADNSRQSLGEFVVQYWVGDDADIGFDTIKQDIVDFAQEFISEGVTSASLNARMADEGLILGSYAARCLKGLPGYEKVVQAGKEFVEITRSVKQYGEPELAS